MPKPSSDRERDRLRAAERDVRLRSPDVAISCAGVGQVAAAAPRRPPRPPSATTISDDRPRATSRAPDLRICRLLGLCVVSLSLPRPRSTALPTRRRGVATPAGSCTRRGRRRSWSRSTARARCADVASAGSAGLRGRSASAPSRRQGTLRSAMPSAMIEPWMIELDRLGGAHAEHDLLELRQEERADRGRDDAAGAAGERRAAEHDGGDRRQQVVVARRRCPASAGSRRSGSRRRRRRGSRAT